MAGGAVIGIGLAMYFNNRHAAQDAAKYTKNKD